MKRTIICSALAFLGIQANAQVEDISVTVSPTASYNWFDNNTAIKDGLMVGGRVGFGFGEYFELRGTYEKSIDIKNTLDKIDVPDNLKNDFEDFKNNNFEKRDVDIERIGGEMKANIPTGAGFAPYITLGAGVQKLSGEKIPDMEQIFVAGGLGTKINLGNRIVLNLEAKNTVFNLDRTNILFQKADKDKFGSLINDTKEDRMYNWSAQAGLQFYLGGREPGTLTDLDRAYLRKFSGGLGGFKLILEPGGNYIDFHKDSNYKDTYMLGGAAGIDFNQYIGLRGFYYQATKNEEISTKWDDMAMYGGEVIARLNVARGISPYLTIGGGYLNVYDSYEGKDTTTGLESSYFAKGGVGLNVPLSQNFEAFGSANLLYTTQLDKDNLNQLRTPDELTKHNMYNVGLRIKLGATANEDEILNHKLNSNQLRFEDRIDELERELKEAYMNNDADKAARVIKEKREIENKSEPQIIYKDRVIENDGESRIKMTPQELEDLVDKVIKDVEAEESEMSDKERIERLEQLLLIQNENKLNYNNNEVKTVKASDQKILDELERLNRKIDETNTRLQYSPNANQDKTIIVGGGNQPVTPQTQAVDSQEGQKTVTQPVAVVDEDGEAGVSRSLFINKGWSLNTGAVIGDKTDMKLGLRGHYGFTNSNLEFQPAIYFGVTGNSAFGLNANLLYNFDFSKSFIVNPYVGIGVGYNSVDSDGKFGGNLIVGTSVDVLDGRLYVDYSALDLANINMVSVGYKFGF